MSLTLIVELALGCAFALALLNRVMPPLPRRPWTAEDELDYRENQPKGKP